MTEVRESGLEERERKDAEKAADNKSRQERLGDIPKEETEESSSEKSAAKPRTKK